MLSAALFFALAAQAAPEAVPTADAGLAIKTFDDFCLRSQSVDQARQKVEAAGFTKGETLSGLGGAPLETYVKAPFNIGLRKRGKGDFSCLVIFAPEPGADNAAVTGMVTALPGLAPRSGKGSASNWRATWTPAQAPPGSKVYLTINEHSGSRGAILTLEAKGKK